MLYEVITEKRFGLRPIERQDIDIVITSYSIHYTKLYERSYLLLCWGYFYGSEPTQKKSCRITSYNVCYTKLLRFYILLTFGRLLMCKLGCTYNCMLRRTKDATAYLQKVTRVKYTLKL